MERTQNMSMDEESMGFNAPTLTMSSSSLTSDGEGRSPPSKIGSPMDGTVALVNAYTVKSEDKTKKRQSYASDFGSSRLSSISALTGPGSTAMPMPFTPLSSMPPFSIGSPCVPSKEQKLDRMKKKSAMRKIGKAVGKFWKKKVLNKSERILGIQTQASFPLSTSGRHQSLALLPTTPVSNRTSLELATPSSVESASSSASKKRRRSGDSSVASIERKNVQWNQRFNELGEYAATHGGSTCVPQKYPPNPQLGKWVQTQRAQYKLYLEERATGEERAKIEMEKKAREIARKKRKKRKIALERGIRLEDVENISDREEDMNEDGVSVDSDKKKGSSKKAVKCSLTTDRVNALNSINFVWEAKVRDPWDIRFTELVEYKKEHGDCLVPQQYPHNPQLGKWVQTQRAQYKLLSSWESSAKGEGNPIKYERTPSLTVERRDKLESVGFVWEVLNQVPWERRMSELIAYKKEHGDCLVPYGYAPNPNLGWWVNIQRQQYRLHKENKPTKMTQDRIDRLEAVGFIWDAHEVTWREKLKELKQYKVEKGNCLVPCNFPPNPSLGKWVMNQRQMYKKLKEMKERIADGTPEVLARSPSRRKSSPGVGIMSQVRIDALEDIGFVWTVKKRGKRKRPSDGSTFSGSTGLSPSSFLSRASSLSDDFSPMSPMVRYQTDFQSPGRSPGNSSFKTPDSNNGLSPTKRPRKTSWCTQGGSINGDIMAEGAPTPVKQNHLDTNVGNVESGDATTRDCIAIM